MTPQKQQITFGSEASFTITVSPATVPSSDTVDVYDVSSATNTPGGNGDATLLGTATYVSTSSTDLVYTFTTLTPLDQGPHLIDAVFTGDPNFGPSYGLASVQVVPASTTPPSTAP